MSLSDLIVKKLTNVTPLRNQATGMGGAVDVGAMMAAALDTTGPAEFDAPKDVVAHAMSGKPSDSPIESTEPTPTFAMAPIVGEDHPEKSFTCLQLQRLIKKDGSTKLPHPDGYFIPEDQEELEMLCHFAENGAGLVRFNPPKDLLSAL